MRLIYHDYIIIFSPNSIFSLCYFPLLFLSLSLSLSLSLFFHFWLWSIYICNAKNSNWLKRFLTAIRVESDAGETNPFASEVGSNYINQISWAPGLLQYNRRLISGRNEGIDQQNQPGSRRFQCGINVSPIQSPVSSSLHLISFLLADPERRIGGIQSWASFANRFPIPNRNKLKHSWCHPLQFQSFAVWNGIKPEWAGAGGGAGGGWAIQRWHSQVLEPISKLKRK